MKTTQEIRDRRDELQKHLDEAGRRMVALDEQLQGLPAGYYASLAVDDEDDS